MDNDTLSRWKGKMSYYIYRCFYCDKKGFFEKTPLQRTVTIHRVKCSCGANVKNYIAPTNTDNIYDHSDSFGAAGFDAVLCVSEEIRSLLLYPVSIVQIHRYLLDKNNFKLWEINMETISSWAKTNNDLLKQFGW